MVIAAAAEPRLPQPAQDPSAKPISRGLNHSAVMWMPTTKLAPVVETTSSTTEISVKLGFSGPNIVLTVSSATRALRDLSWASITSIAVPGLAGVSC